MENQTLGLHVWLPSFLRASITVLFVFALTACSGGSEPNEPESSGPLDDADPNEQAGINTPPEIVVPDSLTISYAGIPATAELVVSDAENNAVRVSWKVDASPEGGDLVIIPKNNFLEANLSATVIGEYEVGVEATDGIASTYKTFYVQVVNTPPLLGDVVIEPGSPNVSSGITARHDRITDSDEDNLAVSYIWQINGGESVTLATPDLSQVPLKRGDSITVEVSVSDGSNEVRSLSSPIIVANSPPEAGAISIEPSDAQASDELSITISSLSDADGDQINSSYRWFLNGGLIAGQNNSVLPAGTARSEDIVRAEVTLADGIDSAVFVSEDVQVSDSPSRLLVEPAQVEMNFGVPSSFEVRFVDDDGEVVQTELVQAPSGLVYAASTGTASWTPTPIMLSKRASFSAQFRSSDGQTESIQISVVNNQKSPPLARSGVSIPGSDFELDTGDFDADGKNEVLSTDSRDHIFTLEFDGTTITQDWLYPYSVATDEKIVRLWSYGSNNSKVLVVTSGGVSLIESRSELPRRVMDTTIEITTAVFDDLDANGVKELLLINANGEMSKLSTEDWELSTFGESLGSYNGSSPVYTAVSGNVDSDSALEIVVDTGQVIDGASGEVQWNHVNRFGALIAIGDIDGDGDMEIVASNRWEDVTSYDPVAKTSLWTYGINDYCSLRLYNVDADPQDELIAGPCQKQSLEILDGSTGTMVLQKKLEVPGYSSSFRSFTFGDLTNDGVDELVFSTGSGSTVEDSMAVVSLTNLSNTTPTVVVNSNPSEIFGFKSIGWDATTTAQERAVFILPNTEGESDGLRIGLLAINGDFTVSDVVAPNWEDVAAGIVVDSDADGINEVVVGVGNVRDGEVHHMSLDDFFQLHLHTALGGTHEYLDPEIVSLAAGVDEDGRAKAIITTSESKIQVYDVVSMQADWTSGGLSGGYMVEAISMQKESGFDIVVATREELTLWKKSGNIYAKSSTAAVECDGLEVVKIGSEDHIACLVSDIWDREATITLFDSKLVKQTELNFNYAITAMKSSPHGDFFIGATYSTGWFFDSNEGTLRTIDPATGSTTWESPAILGQINAISFLSGPVNRELKAAVSTSTAIYIIQ